jgi:hypothetical protein
MGRADGRVRPGQNISTAFSARSWNRAQDAADLVLGERASQAAGDVEALQRAPNIVVIRNTTNSAVERFGVLGISGVDIDPTGGTLEGTNEASARAREFARRPVLRGVLPLTPTHADQFVVLLEPLAANAIGRGVISGCFACRVQIVNANHKFANIKSNDSTQLQSASCGVLQLVWKESGTGSRKWAVGVM